MNAKEMYTKEIERIKTEIYSLLYIAKMTAKDHAEDYERSPNLITFGEKINADYTVELIERTIDKIEYHIPWED